jgi:hypothetical protein
MSMMPVTRYAKEPPPKVSSLTPEYKEIPVGYMLRTRIARSIQGLTRRQRELIATMNNLQNRVSPTEEPISESQ